MRPLLIVTISLTGLVPAMLSGATLRVPAAYPTIQLAIDSSTRGDTILVAPGIYSPAEDITITGRKDLSVHGEGGKTTTTIAGTLVLASSINITVRGFTIVGSVSITCNNGTIIMDCNVTGSHGSGIEICGCTGGAYSNVAVAGNTVFGNSGSGTLAPSIEFDIITSNTHGGIYAGPGVEPYISCNDVWGNSRSPSGNYTGSIADRTGMDGNISSDPFFCNLSIFDLLLAADSPALGQNCGLMGATTVPGCIEHTGTRILPWGMIKSTYQR